MQELHQILAARERLTSAGGEGVLASVVKVEGSVYRRPGARLLVTRAGEWSGGVSGGCLEGDLVRKAWWRTEDGPVLVTYDSTADAETAWHLGLGCNGVVHVLLERLTPGGPDPLAFIRKCLGGRAAGVMATVFRADAAAGVAVGDRFTLGGDGTWDEDGGPAEFCDRVREDSEACLGADRGRTAIYVLPGGEAEVSFEVVRPPIRLIVFGAGFDAVPVTAAAKALGWSVTVVERRPAAAHRPAIADEVLSGTAAVACGRLRPDDRTAAIVMNHNFLDDRDAVAALLKTPVRYVGVLGPRPRTEKLLADVPGLTRVDLGRLHAPVGLDIGAESPEEIAAAVVAQVVAVFAGRDGGHLRDRSGPIHRREPARTPEAVS